MDSHAHMLDDQLVQALVTNNSEGVANEFVKHNYGMGSSTGPYRNGHCVIAHGHPDGPRRRSNKRRWRPDMGNPKSFTTKLGTSKKVPSSASASGRRSHGRFDGAYHEGLDDASRRDVFYLFVSFTHDVSAHLDNYGGLRAA